MIRAISFDLDDTLYDEIQFVKGGFKAVSSYISKNNNISQGTVYQRLTDVLEKQGRGYIFDIVLRELNLYRKELIPKLIEIYRTHKPNISLYPEVRTVLTILRKKGYKLGLITDGNVQVQQSKASALDIEDFFDCMIFSDEYGVENQKPNPLPYKKTLDNLAVGPAELIYVGDNPHKDFVGAKKLGMYAIRVMRGQYKSVILDKEHEADCQIDVLNEIFDILDVFEKKNEKFYCY